MARIELEADHVSVELDPIDEILSLHGSLRLPYDHIRAVASDPAPPGWFRGLRIGTDIPGIKVAGTFLADDGAIFYDFHDPDRCLTFDLDHQRYRRVVVQVDSGQDPAVLVREITARIAPAPHGG